MRKSTMAHEGGGRTHLMLALVIRSLITHPFQDGTREGGGLFVLVNQWLLEKGIILERPMSGETGQEVEWVMWANSPQPSNNRS